MPIRFAYHPGNVAHSSAPEVDETMRAACRSLSGRAAVFENRLRPLHEREENSLRRDAPFSG